MAATDAVLNTPSASQASSTRSIADAEPDARASARRPAARPARRSDRRRRCRSGPRRARRRRTRTSCACSSRSPGPAGGRSCRRRRATSRPARTRAKCAAQGSQRWSRKRGASSVAARHSGDLQSSTRSGFSRCRARCAGHSSSAPLGQEGAEERDVAGLARAVAHGVQLERDVAQAEPGEEVVGEGDHLDVEVGVRRPERLDPQLVVLAVAAVLGVLVAERRRHVPGLPRWHRVVLDVGPGDGSGALGPQRHQLAVAVLEDVHLLADHLAALADAAQEDAGVLEDRGDGEAVAGALDQLGEAGDRVLPAGRLRPEHVVHALGRAGRGPLLRRLAPNPSGLRR